jgi:LuxR family maltose regulon positive regulatory protein
MNQHPRDSKVGVSTGYIKKLIKLLQKDTAHKMQALSARNGNYSHAWRAVEPLTEKELEVLRLLALEMKNSGISEMLNISVNTVKVHTRNIYNKLMVRNRYHAVERARELKIIKAHSSK